MGFLDLFGCEGQDLTFDNITVQAGSSPVYDSGPLPVGSKSAWALRGTGTWSRPWPGTPSGTRYQMKFSAYMTANNTNNDQFHIGCGNAGTEMITISSVDSTALITIRLNGAVVATAGSGQFNSGVFDNHFLIKVDQQTGGKIEVWKADDISGSPLVEYTLTGGDITALGGLPTGWYIKGKTSDNSSAVDDFFCIDPDDATGVVDIFDLAAFSVKAQVFNGAGNSQQWSGTFAEIDDVPFNDSDKISTALPNQKSDFAHGPIGEDQVLGVRMSTRTLRSGTDAGVNIRAYQREGGLETATPAQPAPGAGTNEFIFDVARDGTAYTAAKHDATTYGVESIT